MTILCREKLEVWVEHYPFHTSLNKKLIEEFGYTEETIAELMEELKQ